MFIVATFLPELVAVPGVAQGGPISFTHFALFLCTDSALTCEPATWKVIEPDGAHYYPFTRGKLEYCLDDGRRASSLEPDAAGKFFVEYNKWYECRKLDSEGARAVKDQRYSH
jgi:hypothetical protein